MHVHWVALLGILMGSPDNFASASSAAVDASGNVQMESSHDSDSDPTNVIPPRVQTPLSDFPDNWREYTYEDIRGYFGCRQYYAQSNLDKPLPSMGEWNFLRSVYNSVVDPDKKWDDPVPPTEGYSIELWRPEPPPFYAKMSPKLGRGVFAVSVLRPGKDFGTEQRVSTEFNFIKTDAHFLTNDSRETSRRARSYTTGRTPTWSSPRPTTGGNTSSHFLTISRAILPSGIGCSASSRGDPTRWSVASTFRSL